MPTSITVVATSTSAPPRGEGGHRLLLLARAHLPVQEHDAEVLELGRLQALELGGRGARLQRLGLLDQRADHERLAAGAQLLADALVGPRALALAGGDEGVDRAAAGGQLAQHGDVEVAVGGQRERARDRRGGHVQHVRREARRRLAVERAALVDAEAVLLVDHDDARRSNSTASSISAWVPTSSRSSPVASLPSRSVRRAAGVEPVSSAAWHELARHQLLQRREVLLGERLGRRHQRRLARRPRPRAASRRARRRSCPSPTSPISSRCIGRSPARSASTVSIAWRWSSVGVNGSESASQRRRQLAGRLERLGAGALAAAGAAAQQRDLEQQQLLEREPAAAALVVAEVGGVERGGAVGQPLEHAQPGGQRLERLARARRGARGPGRGSASRTARRWRGRSPSSPSEAPTASPVGAWN